MNKELFKKLSKNARTSLRMASVISKELFALEVTPMDIFLGVLLNDKSLGSRALLAMGVETNLILKNYTGGKVFSFEEKQLSAEKNIRLSKAAKDVIRISYSYASKFSHVYVGTEHLLLAILSQKSLKFTKELASAGMTEKFFKENLMNFATYPVGLLMKPGQAQQQADDQGPLAFLGKDLVVQAKEGKLDPLVGRENELEQIINILSRRRKNNPIIVGEPGVGKTAIIEGLAQLVAAGTVPNSLLNSKIISLDIPAIIAGSKLRGDVEEKMMAIIKEVTETPNVILFIDEIHNILSTNTGGGGLDMASVLKPALVRDDFRVVGATTSTEYTRYFEEDNALVRRFQPLYIEEPSIDETIQILHRVEPLLEKHHNVNISEEAIAAAAKLSDRYVSDRYLPDKAIDLLDEAAASKRLQLEVKYKDIADIFSEYQQAVKKKESAVLQGDMTKANRWRETEDRLRKELDYIDKRRSRSKNTAQYKVDVETVQNVVSKWTGIPVTTIGGRETELLRNLEKFLKEGVVGQGEAVEIVAKAIKRARTGIADADRPWASLLFLGPTGVGKTELAKVLTKLLFGDEDRLIQIDMSELMEMHSVSKLIGSPPGYIGYREGGQLTERVRQRPHCVILFDEIEKAHPDVLNILLQIMEYGHLTDGKGHKVNFKNTVVILTSNIGAEEIRKDKILGFSGESVQSSRADSEIENAYDSMRDELINELKDTLRPELLNRLDDIVIFRSLTRVDAKEIVKILNIELNRRLKEQGVEVVLTRRALDHIAGEGFSEEYGARNLRRVLQDEVESAIADYILDNRELLRQSGGKQKSKKLTVDYTDGVISVVA